MKDLEWKDEYSLGIPAVDLQHERIFGCFVTRAEEGLSKHDKWLSDSSVVQLVGLLQQHFTLEESLMRILGYPELAPHIEEHRRFHAEVNELARKSLRTMDRWEREWLVYGFPCRRDVGRGRYCVRATIQRAWIPWTNALTRLMTYSLVVLLAVQVRLQLEREHENATQDALTGLQNRRAFLQAGASEVERSRRYMLPMTVVYLDRDDFKQLLIRAIQWKSDKAALQRDEKQMKAGTKTMKSDKASGRMAAKSKDSETVFRDSQNIKGDKKDIAADKAKLKADQKK